VVCCDASGECLGIVRFERLVEALSG
jgi:hypothetical protein